MEQHEVRELPCELWALVCGGLALEDLARLSAVSRALRRIIVDGGEQSEHIWLAAAKRAFAAFAEMPDQSVRAAAIELQRKIRNIPEAVDAMSRKASRRAAVRQLVELGANALAPLERLARDPERLARAYQARLAAAEVRQSLAEREMAALCAPANAARGVPCTEFPYEDGAILIARWADPSASREAVLRRLDELADGFCRVDDPSATDAERCERLAKYLFVELGYGGNRENYYREENSLIHRLLDSKQGIPISLSVLFAAVARRAGLPVRMVGAPQHFLVKAREGPRGEPAAPGEDLRPDAWRYVDCFGGRAMRLAELQGFFGFPLSPAALESVSPRDVFCRMLRNLIGIYQQNDDLHRLHAGLGVLLGARPSPADRFLRASVAIALQRFDEVRGARLKLAEAEA
eukprot:tig00020510_g9892.t1